MIDTVYARNCFCEYVKDYDANNGKIALKIAHTLRVSDLSKKIAISLNLTDEDIELAELIGLLHDIGRFEQIKQYNTYNDRNSIDHAEYGVKILFDDNIIEKFGIDKKYYPIIKTAILNHNKLNIDTNLSEKELLHSKIIRDSDKLDIYNVLITDSTKNTYGCISLENETFSNEVINAFKKSKLIDYKYAQTHGDMWIVHMAYIYNFYFKNSYSIIKENNYINRLLEKANFQNKDTYEKAIEIVNISNEYINSKL